MRKKYENLNYESHKKPTLPPVSVEYAKSCYFVYDNEVHALRTASDAVFKAAVLSLAPYWISAPQYSRVLRDTMDIWARWYLLCALADSHRPMSLFATREEAVQSCGVASAVC